MTIGSKGNNEPFGTSCCVVGCTVLKKGEQASDKTGMNRTYTHLPRPWIVLLSVLDSHSLSGGRLCQAFFLRSFKLERLEIDLEASCF